MLTKQQQEAVERFQKLKVGALFMQMGTGKTRAAVEIINYNRPDFLLYLTPYNTKDNIRKELAKWCVCCPYLLVGYESIASSSRIYLETMDEIKKHQNVFIVADESIFIKNGRTKRLQRAKELRKYCEYALILNGTPLVKNEWDLFNQMSFLSPKIIPYNSYEFIEKFFVEHHERRGGREKHYYTFYEPNRPALTKLIAPYVYEADLEFDKQIYEYTFWVGCDEDTYNRRKNETLEKFGYGEEALISLFQVLQHEAAIAPEKNNRVAEYIDGRQVICFCNYLEEVEQIKNQCDCFVITGDTKEKDRVRILTEFEHSQKPLIMTMGIGSYSLNLQYCKEIVYSSLTFNYGMMKQSQFRIKRTGQENDIQYTYILGRFGINEMMFANLDKKLSLANIIKNLIENEDISAFLEQTDPKTALSDIKKGHITTK